MTNLNIHETREVKHIDLTPYFIEEFLKKDDKLTYVAGMEIAKINHISESLEAANDKHIETQLQSNNQEQEEIENITTKHATTPQQITPVQYSQTYRMQETRQEQIITSHIIPQQINRIPHKLENLLCTPQINYNQYRNYNRRYY